MRSTITKSQQEYINQLLEKRKKKDTLSMLTISQQRERITEQSWESKVARNGMTYLEIEQFNNTYNNFR